MSPHSVWPSQVTTVLRKLPTISPTPMVTETATISAAMATAVRLSAPVTLRGAMRPSTPKSLPVTRHGATHQQQGHDRGQQGEADGHEEDAGKADGSISAAVGGRAAQQARPPMPAARRRIRPDRPASTVSGTARRACSSMPERHERQPRRHGGSLPGRQRRRDHGRQHAQRPRP